MTIRKINNPKLNETQSATPVIYVLQYKGKNSSPLVAQVVLVAFRCKGVCFDCS